MYKPIFFLLILTALAACNNNPDKPAVIVGEGPRGVDIINYSVISTRPHDTTSFTEGLIFHDGVLYESTGCDSNMPDNRWSAFGVIDPVTGKLDKKVEINRHKYFGEGICFLNGKVYQLTWQQKIGFIYDAKTFKKLGEFPLPTAEGWGMTTDGTNLIISDGTSNLSYMDPNTFRLTKVVGVTDNNGPDSNINELELIKGFIYANQWETNYILKIDPSSGKVVGKMDLTSLVEQAHNKNPGAEVLNGIAYDSVTNKVYVTGKLWSDLYEIKFNQ